MKPTKKQLKEIQEIEKKVSKVCDTKETFEVTRDDNNVIINKETGKPHFEAIDFDAIKKMVKEKKSRDIYLNLNFDESSPSLKKQIKKQGWLLTNRHFKGAEKLRKKLNYLFNIGILKEKEAEKCFKRLNKMLCETIEETLID